MFRNREHAGRELAKALREFKGHPEAFILGIPRGGAVVADVLSRALDVPWDVFISQKLEAPWDPELAIGAVTETGTVVLNEDLLNAFPVPGDYLANAVRCQCFLAQARQHLYRGDRHLPPIAGRIILLVDDRAATGASLLAAAKSLKALKPAILIAAVPAASVFAINRIKHQVNSLVTLGTCRGVPDIGYIYKHADPIADRTALEKLFLHRREMKHPHIEVRHPSRTERHAETEIWKELKETGVGD